MKPIYFPFTYVPAAVAEALASCFGQFIVYRPSSENIPARMQSWVAREVLDVRVPVIEYEAELQTMVKNCQSWAASHSGSLRQKPTSLKTHQGAMPFFNELSSSKIVADIKQKILDRPAGSRPDPVFKARLFLALAQEFDRHHDELASGLKEHDQGVADLMGQLVIAADSPPGGRRQAAHQFADTFADYMISDRLKAWIRLVLRDPDCGGIFVTHSTAAMAHLLDKAGTAARVARIESIPLDTAQTDWGRSWQKSLAINLSRVVQDKLAEQRAETIGQPDFPAAEKTVALDLYRVPDQKPRDFFAGCAALGGMPTAETDRKDPISNTLLALIEC